MRSKKAVICFWYDAETNSGGHNGYFSCYPHTNPEELYTALLEISNKEIADNYLEANKNDEEDGYITTDTNYYSFEPSFDKYLNEYVKKNKKDIFN